MATSEMDFLRSTLNAIDRPRQLRILFTGVKLAKDPSKSASVILPAHPTTRTSRIENVGTDPGLWPKSDVLPDLKPELGQLGHFFGAGVTAAVGIAVHFFSPSQQLWIVAIPKKSKLFSLSIVLLLIDATYNSS